MAVGETSGQSGPKRLITAGGGRRRLDQAIPGIETDADEPVVTNGVAHGELVVEAQAEPVEVPEASPEVADVAETAEAPEAPVADLIAPPAVPDELEKRLAEDEEIERRNRHEHHETPHFRREAD